MQRIADDFAAINARLSEISAEKAKVRGEEPKPEDKPVVVNYAPGWSYQAPDDYCGFKPFIGGIPVAKGEKVAIRPLAIGTIKRTDGSVLTLTDWTDYEAREHRDSLIEASLASSRALKKSSDELSRVVVKRILSLGQIDTGADRAVGGVAAGSRYGGVEPFGYIALDAAEVDFSASYTFDSIDSAGSTLRWENARPERQGDMAVFDYANGANGRIIRLAKS